MMHTLAKFRIYQIKTRELIALTRERGQKQWTDRHTSWARQKPSTKLDEAKTAEVDTTVNLFIFFKFQPNSKLCLASATHKQHWVKMVRI